MNVAEKQQIKSCLGKDIMKWACRIADLEQQEAPDVLVLNLIECLLKSTYALVELMPEEIVEKTKFENVSIKDLIGEAGLALAEKRLNGMKRWEEKDIKFHEKMCVRSALESLQSIIEKNKRRTPSL